MQNRPQKHNQIDGKHDYAKRHKRNLIVSKLIAVCVYKRQGARVAHGVRGLAVEKNEIVLIQLTDGKRNRRWGYCCNRPRTAQLESFGRWSLRRQIQNEEGINAKH